MNPRRVCTTRSSPSGSLSGGFSPSRRLLVTLCASLALGAACGKDAPPGPAPSPAVEVAVPEDWTASPAEVAAAPTVLRASLDEYTVRFRPGPSRAMLEKKAEVYRAAFRFFRGVAGGRADARRRLVDLGLATARFLMDLPGVLVPKSMRPPPDPDALEVADTPEDLALDVIREIQAGYLERGDIDALMTFFSAATGKVIDLDARLSGIQRSLRNRPVHPQPALWSVGMELGCDTNALDPAEPVARLFLPVLLDLKVHGEDVAWLLSRLASQGGFDVDLGPGVAGPVHIRVRADTFEEAVRNVSENAGFSVEEMKGGFRVREKE